uniref:solute carrier family 22 member 6 isoform X3 n=1 Tax=Doryrhamphus excisus TaxID=161450 RepID=UPI0025AE1E6E|nr:solute carrier family 22 member 6 isoform X3 [Doryrhamphus excisus]
MGFSELLEEMGGFGRYQWLHVTLISLPGLLMASQNLLNNFVSGTPSHHCSLSANHSLLQVEQTDALKAFIPLDSSGTRLDRCSRFVTPQWHLLAANSSANTSHLHTESCLDGWTFDRSEFLATTVSEWELVCSLRPLKQMIQTIYMGGVLSGAIVYGGLSDRFGRRTVLVWSYLQLGILGCSSALSPSYSIYCVFSVSSAASMSAVGHACCLSSEVEWIPTKARTLVGTLTSFFFTFGQLILAGLAYWLRDWRKLQLVVCAPQFLFFAYSWWYSESARWLVLKRKSEKALKTLHRVARINGKQEVVDKLTLEVLHSHMKKEMESSQTMMTAYDLVRTAGMRRISVCLIAVWFSTSFAYYGLAMDLQKFGLSIYMIQIIFGAVDFPAKLVALGMLSYLGRRVSQASCLFMSALIIFANIFVPTGKTQQRTLTTVGVANRLVMQTCRPSEPRWRVSVRPSCQRPSPPSICTRANFTPPSSDWNGSGLHHGQSWQHGGAGCSHPGRGVPFTAQRGLRGGGCGSLRLCLLPARDAQRSTARHHPGRGGEMVWERLGLPEDKGSIVRR